MKRLAAVSAILVFMATGAYGQRVTCKDAMTQEYRDQTAWWTPGHRPAECAGVSDAAFAALADEVTSY